MADDVQVANRRLDASENEALIGMARMGAGAFGYTADLRIDRGLAQLLRLRVSQLNKCTYCLNLHYQAAREAASLGPRSTP
jgi:AhpD family alkylhydroperoxidase